MEAADRFGVSRTHVRNLMKDAEKAWIGQDHRAGWSQHPHPAALLAGYDRGLAVGMYLHDAVNVVAMNRWAKSHKDSGTTPLPDLTVTASHSS